MSTSDQNHSNFHLRFVNFCHCSQNLQTMPQILSRKSLHGRTLSSQRRPGFSLRHSGSSRAEDGVSSRSDGNNTRSSLSSSNSSSTSRQSLSNPFFILRVNSRSENVRYRRNNSASSMLHLGQGNGNREEDAWGHFIDVAEAEQEIARHSRILSAKPVTSDTFLAYY